MLKYALRRFGVMLVSLFIIATATFFLLSAIPGNPLSERVEKLPLATKEEIYKKYGYDKPVFTRYIKCMEGIILRGDFGQSIVYPGETMSSIMKAKLPVSARLGLQQLIVGVPLGMLLGAIAAVKRGTWADYLIVTLAMFLVSTPVLVMSLILQRFLAGGSLPIIGWPSGPDLWLGGWKYTILPTLAGCLGYLAGYSRLTRTIMLDSINQDYVLTARAKGLSEKAVIAKHVIRNSFIPMATVLPGTIAGIIAGSFFVERVFAIPGVGRYFIDAIYARDVPIIMGNTVLFAGIFIISIFISDILYTLIDPRIRIAGGKR